MQRPLQIAGIVGLISINKDQVERRNVTEILSELSAGPSISSMRSFSPREVNILAGHIGVRRVSFERNQLPSGGRARAIQIEL